MIDVKIKLLNPILLAGIMGLPAVALACDECGDDSCIDTGATQTTEDGNNYQIVRTEGDVTDDGNGNITTGEDSSCVILFDNGSMVQLGSDNELNVDTFLEDPFAASTAAANAIDDSQLVGPVKKLSTGGPKKSSGSGSPATGAAGIRG